ncbi:MULTISPECIES: Sak single strand annealing protein [Bacillus]|nr:MULTISPECIES: DUF1071 domain-containing protein [Bacillus cereus group]EAO57207.1 Hypothetical protein RBTH_07183 [Bacillus thuringiensis serovar israelensis ATCC 35646]MEC3358677.1 DUF1071 domain-containing protein [Bacillus paranthracis]MEC3459759.1 DUF1071 domain-containing protein [Bacillus thuringiensis]MED3452999.1 DUF1071 domain-containing protein [Bacillus thuringiensis]
MTAVTTEAPPVEQDVVEEPVKLEKNYFAEMAGMDVTKYLEKKNGFSYMSWAHAVEQLKRKHPDAKINVKRFPEPETGGLLVPYIRTALGYFVEVEVIVNGVSVSEPFPVLDFRNKPIAKPTTFDINNSIQRAKVKAIAGHGLGLYVYAGEDLPVDSDDKGPNQAPQNYQQQNYQQQQQQQQYQNPPQQQNPYAATEPQKHQMRDLAMQIATLTLGAGATQENVVAKLKDIYGQFKITSNLTKEIADVKINELGAAVKAIHDNRMVQQAQVAQQTQSNTLFNMPQAQ